MSEQGLPRTAEEAQQFMNDMTFAEPPSPEEEAELLASLPPRGSAVMVVRSLRLPLELHERIKAVAEARGVPASTLIREWIEVELAALENDEPISRADVLRAVAGLRPIGGDNAA